MTETERMLAARTWIEDNKHEKPFAAGALAYIVGHQCLYGCHYGLRSSREWAREQFGKGWHAAFNDENTGAFS